ncbi:SWI/SNF complex subunit Snf59 [Schizosaccharomyces pombe]|uniref:SWI/SNF global transcription activator complex subunit snf59 n=1 Tax=Schizosaccharomyces pombe (strain 972 / ATCC 24843) TaxID=284812 RepID=SNF59_SCHPO|nr:SWI/SNF complex subunit Snf59 [Schizosaccharomyces pombe]O74792.1 RecName: Full=SWI/SNF global transcription activator complex subunit snf59 [Schizosaccharomyces pombe 972h-]CAA21101.1 SWI/SNF complex subunit Snf59 [Schizosaccharomyces pombe]|eukprot:NP_596652.1 SWI/SNF complex subunit Snf59 [Schizosaccharomyces pombe]
MEEEDITLEHSDDLNKEESGESNRVNIEEPEHHDNSNKESTNLDDLNMLEEPKYHDNSNKESTNLDDLNMLEEPEHHDNSKKESTNLDDSNMLEEPKHHDNSNKESTNLDDLNMSEEPKHHDSSNKESTNLDNSNMDESENQKNFKIEEPKPSGDFRNEGPKQCDDSKIEKPELHVNSKIEEPIHRIDSEHNEPEYHTESKNEESEHNTKSIREEPIHHVDSKNEEPVYSKIPEKMGDEFSENSLSKSDSAVKQEGNLLIHPNNSLKDTAPSKCKEPPVDEALSKKEISDDIAQITSVTPITEKIEDKDKYISEVIDTYGKLADGFEYRAKTFCLEGRGKVLYMLGTECSRLLGFKDSYFMFHKTPSLRKVLTTQSERDQMVEMGLLASNFRFRQLSIVPARQMFLAFGARILMKGTIDPESHKALIEKNISWADDEYYHMDVMANGSTRSSSVKLELKSMDNQNSPSPFQGKDILTLAQGASFYNSKVMRTRNLRKEARLSYYTKLRGVNRSVS